MSVTIVTGAACPLGGGWIVDRDGHDRRWIRFVTTSPATEPHR